MFEIYQHLPVRCTSESAVCFCKLILLIKLLYSFNSVDYNALTLITNVQISDLYNLLCRGEPLKRKKKIDPMIIKMRTERKKRKIEKQIRRLEKLAKQLKPIDEVEIPYKLINEKE